MFRPDGQFTPERVLPTTSVTHLHSRQAYLCVQVTEWLRTGNTHLSAQQPAVTAKMATVTRWPSMKKTKPSKMRISGSDKKTCVSVDKLCVMQQLKTP